MEGIVNKRNIVVPWIGNRIGNWRHGRRISWGRPPLESPSVDFTQKLMQGLELERQKEVYRFRPLVAKGSFALLFIGLAGLFGYLVRYGEAFG